jgi:predicted nuclease with TOPRIM domain
VITIGIDIGQTRDPTAICVAETELRQVEGRSEMHFVVRHLERLALGTRYPRVVERVTDITSRVQAKTGEGPVLYLDATGVGQPVVDILQERLPGGWIVPTFFTHGDRRVETREGEGVRVSLGKAFMVSRLQTLLQNRRLHLPRSREAETLTEELQNYELRVSENANDTYGAFRVGTHDDLVTALGLATQVDRPPWRQQSWASHHPWSQRR